uniref:Uncharacterized protein n=1 Tax=Panagrolaimus superbus TaxID=310955 RepID=A0A914ZG22_9BILA
MLVKSVTEKSTSSAAFICGVLKYCIAKKTVIERSQPYQYGFDDAARLIYLRTVVRFQNLDTGSDIEEKRKSKVEFYSQPGDKLHDNLPKKLGGSSLMGNWFPLKSNTNIKEWESALEKVM